tara:strand:- start:28 stop:198 length:171 start_codon:yes stop_codon:yes gene_type:complete
VVGKLVAVFNRLVGDPAIKWLFIEDFYNKVQQDSTGAATEKVEAIGKSRAGNKRKI